MESKNKYLYSFVMFVFIQLLAVATSTIVILYQNQSSWGVIPENSRVKFSLNVWLLVNTVAKLLNFVCSLFSLILVHFNYKKKENRSVNLVSAFSFAWWVVGILMLQDQKSFYENSSVESVYKLALAIVLIDGILTGLVLLIVCIVMVAVTCFSKNARSEPRQTQAPQVCIDVLEKKPSPTDTGNQECFHPVELNNL